MLYSLLTAALLMGLAGLPHCGAMCAAPCAAALPKGVPLPAVLGRTLGYAALGAVASGGMGLLAGWSRWAAALQPVWVMLLAATALLGGWMALKGAMPAAVQAHGLRWYRRLHQLVGDPAVQDRHPSLKPVLPLVLGVAWAALPCGLLYGAVAVAALAGSPVQGALVMSAFSMPGAVLLWWLPRRLSLWRMAGLAGAKPLAGAGAAVVPVLWHPTLSASRMSGPPLAPANSLVITGQGGTGLASPFRARWPWLADPRWAVRMAGAMLCASASWALAQRLQAQWLAWCA